MPEPEVRIRQEFQAARDAQKAALRVANNVGASAQASCTITGTPGLPGIVQQSMPTTALTAVGNLPPATAERATAAPVAQQWPMSATLPHQPHTVAYAGFGAAVPVIGMHNYGFAPMPATHVTTVQPCPVANPVPLQMPHQQHYLVDQAMRHQVPPPVVAEQRLAALLAAAPHLLQHLR